MKLPLPALVVAISVTSAVPAVAQRVSFERTLDATGIVTLDVLTERGAIEIAGGEPGRIVVSGAATVRLSWNTPSNAPALAREVAANPPLERAGSVLRLRPPADPKSRDAVTVNYRVYVPPGVTVVTVTDSGATSVRQVGGPVSVRTQSSAIDLWRVERSATIRTGSGAVTAERIGGDLSVSTSSSRIMLRDVGGSLEVRTQSGAVDAGLTGSGNADVRTGSSAVRLTGVTGGARVETQSGRIAVDGAPGAAWEIVSNSGSVELEMAPRSAFALDAVSRSSSVSVNGAAVQGTVSRRSAVGTVDGGDRVVRIRTGSTIEITRSPRL
jgi:hypothetical protein